MREPLMAGKLAEGMAGGLHGEAMVGARRKV